MSNTSRARARALRREALAAASNTRRVHHSAERSNGGWLATSRVMGSGVGDPYLTHATVFRCVRVIVSAFKRPDLVAMKGQPPRGVEVDTGPWASLLKHPNPWQTERQLLEATGTYLLLTGECGWVLFNGDWEPAGMEEVPTYMVPVPKQAIEIDYGDDSALGVRAFRGYDVQLSSGENIPVPPWAMVHTHYAMDPTDPMRGIGPIGAAALAMNTDQKAEAWSNAFFDNAAEPGGILTTDGVLSPKQREDMREAWEAKHRGYTKHAKVAVLEGGLTYQQVGISQRDMDFIQQRQWNDTQIARVFGVPKFFLMDDTDTSYASTRQHKRSLWELAVLPLIENVEDAAYARMTSPRDATVWLSFNLATVEALAEDLLLNLDAATKLTALGYPVNQVNDRLGLEMPEQEWGDEGTLPMGLAPATEVAEGMDEYEEGPAENPDTGGDNEEGGPESNPEALPQEDKATDPIRGNGVHRADMVCPEGVDPVAFKVNRQAWAEVYRTSMRPFERRFRRRVSAFMLQLQRDINRFLKTQDRAMDPGTLGALDAFLEDSVERWTESLMRRTRPVYKQVAGAAAGQAGKELGGLNTQNVTQQIVNPSVVTQMSLKHMAGMVDVAKDEVRKVLVEGIAAGEPINDLQTRVKNATDVNLSRSLKIARTEVAQTTNLTRQTTFQEEGIKRQKWIVANLAFARDETHRTNGTPADHRSLDGEVRSVGEPFVDSEGTGGAPLMYPGDVRCPGQWVINCRCTTTPVRE